MNKYVMKLLAGLRDCTAWYCEMYTVILIVMAVVCLGAYLSNQQLEFKRQCDELQGVVHMKVCVSKTSNVLLRR